MQNRNYGLPTYKTHPSPSCPQEITTTEKNQEARGNSKQKKKKKNFHKASFPSVLKTNLNINIILHKPG